MLLGKLFVQYYMLWCVAGCTHTAGVSRTGWHNLFVCAVCVVRGCGCHWRCVWVVRTAQSRRHHRQCVWVVIYHSYYQKVHKTHCIIIVHTYSTYIMHIQYIYYACVIYVYDVVRWGEIPYYSAMQRSWRAASVTTRSGCTWRTYTAPSTGLRWLTWTQTRMCRRYAIDIHALC